MAVKTLVVHDALLGVEGRRRQRAILEAAISTSLQHPNVVSTYAFEVKPLGVVAPAAPQAGQSKGSSGPTRSDAEERTGDTAGEGPGVGDSGGVGDSQISSGARNVWESAGDVYKLYIIQVRSTGEYAGRYGEQAGGGRAGYSGGGRVCTGDWS